VVVNPCSIVRPAGQRRVFRTGLLASAGAVFVLAGLALSPRPAAGAATVVDTDDFSLALGLRLQPRFIVVGPDLGGRLEWQRDFLVQRSRFKMNGDVLSVLYAFEWRVDGSGANADNVVGAPVVDLENGWIELPLAGPEFAVRAGVYDQPFSRDRLTSDSKQMVVDRSTVSNVPAVAGVADNAYGFDFRGTVNGGRFMYAVGAFDNKMIAASLQDLSPMVVGRVDVNLGSTKDVYQDAHFGEESWFSFGLNGGYQDNLELPASSKNTIVGVDGMVDIPLGPGRLLGRAELNSMTQDVPGTSNSLRTNLWMLGGGYLFWNQKLQPTFRFDQQIDDDDANTQGRTSNIAILGVNYYKQGHGLKVQADVSFASGTKDAVDRGRVQLQVDF
jgi:hypothetical protein